ncbi:MAG: hypothetical protein PWP24_14 [Clostridiales bacterium]|nr:hypothetical protein [Clostridiales bacterium]
MMQVEYKRDMYRNYLVLLCDQSLFEGYEIGMLQNNKIKGLLPVTVKRIDQDTHLYYDITSMQPVAEVYQKCKLTKDDIILMTEGVLEGLLEAKKYLLLEDNVVVDPNYLFMNPEGGSVSLCYIPGYNQSMKEQLSKLFEFILDRVDYEKEQAVCLSYALYKKSKEKNGSVYDLKALMREAPLEKEERAVVSQNSIPDKDSIKGEEKKSILGKAKEIEETLRYPWYLWMAFFASVLFAGSAFYIVLRIGFFRDPWSNTIIIPRFLLAIIILIAVLLLVAELLFQKKHKLSQMKTKLVEISSEPLEELPDRTVVLFEREGVSIEGQYQLAPLDTSHYEIISLIEFPFFVGKLAKRVDGVINHDSVSRFHAKIEREGDCFYLADLNSTNGTYHNNQRLEANERVKIEYLDRISFGQVTYIFNKI